jgi:hypothetical protein
MLHQQKASWRPGWGAGKGSCSEAVAKITGDPGLLLAFYDYPAEHWIHLRTTSAPPTLPVPPPSPARRRTLSRPGSVKGCPKGRRQAPLTGSGRLRQ